MSEELRKCTECGQIKKLNSVYFYRNSHGQYGFAAKCKVCIKKLRRERYHTTQARKKTLISFKGR